MPYRGPQDNPWDLADLQLQAVDQKIFHILTPFHYAPTEAGLEKHVRDHLHLDAWIHVPGGPVPSPHHPTECEACTDLASVPSALRGVLATYGRHLPAALVHDYLCNKSDAAKGQDKALAANLRDFADYIFITAMRDKELARPMNNFQSRLFWAGVTAARYWLFHKVALVALVVTAFLGWCSTYLLLNTGFRLWGGKPSGHWYWQSWFTTLVFLGLIGAAGLLATSKTGPPKRWITVPLYVLGVGVGVWSLYLALPLNFDPHTMFTAGAWFDKFIWQLITTVEWLPLIILLVGAYALAATATRLANPNYQDSPFCWVLFFIAPFVVPVFLVTLLTQTIISLPGLLHRDLNHDFIGPVRLGPPVPATAPRAAQVAAAGPGAG